MYGKTNYNAGNPEDPETIRKATSEHYFGRNALNDDGTYKNFIDGFGSIDQVISSVFKTSEYDDSTTVSNAIVTLAANAETLAGDFSNLQTRVGLDDNNGLSARITANETDILAIEKDLGPATSEGSVRHTLVQLATADSTLDKKISDLGDNFTTFTQELNTNLENYVSKSDYEAKIAEYNGTIAKLLERLDALENIHSELTPDPEPEIPEGEEDPEPENPDNEEELEPEDEGSTTV